MEITGDTNGTLECTLDIKSPQKYFITYENNGGTIYTGPQIKTEGGNYMVLVYDGEW